MRIESNATFIPPMRLGFLAPGGVLMSVQSGDKVYGIQEGYARNREGTGDNRYQVLLMPTGNTLSAFWTDLGPASQFLMDVGGEQKPAPAYLQPILMEHTVDECLHMAAVSRMDTYAADLLAKNIAESNIFEEYARIIEEDLYIIKNRSTFGYGGKTQRTGYSRTAAALRKKA